MKKILILLFGVGVIFCNVQDSEVLLAGKCIVNVLDSAVSITASGDGMCCAKREDDAIRVTAVSCLQQEDEHTYVDEDIVTDKTITDSDNNTTKKISSVEAAVFMASQALEKAFSVIAYMSDVLQKAKTNHETIDSERQKLALHSNVLCSAYKDAQSVLRKSREYVWSHHLTCVLDFMSTTLLEIGVCYAHSQSFLMLDPKQDSVGMKLILTWVITSIKKARFALSQGQELLARDIAVALRSINELEISPDNHHESRLHSVDVIYVAHKSVNQVLRVTTELAELSAIFVNVSLGNIASQQGLREKIALSQRLCVAALTDTEAMLATLIKILASQNMESFKYALREVIDSGKKIVILSEQIILFAQRGSNDEMGRCANTIIAYMRQMREASNLITVLAANMTV